MVLIHGSPPSAKAWQSLVLALPAAGYRQGGYDQRCFGHSDKPESGYSYDTLADDLQRVMGQGDLHGLTLVGLSMGGGEVACMSAGTANRGCTAWFLRPSCRRT